MCRSGPLDTLIIFTTTISVSNMYSTNIVMVPIIWLYITVVVVVISFSIIVSCIFISWLLVTVGIVYSKMGSNINVIVSIFLILSFRRVQYVICFLLGNSPASQC